MVRLNLFSGHRISGKTREAKASLQQIQSVYENMKLGIRVETQQAFLQALSTWKQIQVAETSVRQSEESLRIVKNRYKNGLLTIVGLMDAEVALQQARIRHFRSLHDYKISRIMLAKAAGIIDIDFH
jgi:outer membrane protein TolC